jgi:heme-degrading monooxygenase HmoA
MTWSDYEKVTQALNVDGDPPPGLIVHAAGEVDGKWRSVDVWESEADYNRFREERLMPAVIQAMGEEAVAAGPPPQESFEVKHLVTP